MLNFLRFCLIASLMTAMALAQTFLVQPVGLNKRPLLPIAVNLQTIDCVSDTSTDVRYFSYEAVLGVLTYLKFTVDGTQKITIVEVKEIPSGGIADTALMRGAESGLLAPVKVVTGKCYSPRVSVPALSK
jgi:hypothetical protein